MNVDKIVLFHITNSSSDYFAMSAIYNPGSLAIQMAAAPLIHTNRKKKDKKNDHKRK